MFPEARHLVIDLRANGLDAAALTTSPVSLEGCPTSSGPTMLHHDLSRTSVTAPTTALRRERLAAPVARSRCACFVGAKRADGYDSVNDAHCGSLVMG